MQGLNHSTGKNIGIYPEIKAPWFHKQEGKDISSKVLAVLKQYGYTGKNDNVYLQCFDANELKRIKNELEPKLGMDLKLVQLIAYNDWQETYEQKADGKWVEYDYDWMFKLGAMKKIAQYADGIGPDYHMLVVADQSAGPHRADRHGERSARQQAGGAPVHHPRRCAAEVRDRREPAV